MESFFTRNKKKNCGNIEIYEFMAKFEILVRNVNFFLTEDGIDE